MKIRYFATLALCCAIGLSACTEGGYDADTTTANITTKLNQYTSFTLTADMSALSENERKMIPILIEAADIMDALFQDQAYGDPTALFASAGSDDMRRYMEINYGPWDRLDGDASFVSGVGEKPKGANLYPADITVEEFEAAAADNPDLKNLYTLVRRDANGGLEAVWYHDAYADQVNKAADLILQAAELADEPGLKKYLTLRAQAMRDDDYQPSDLAWMDMVNNRLDVVIGPIETYEDQLFGYKASHEAYVLIKDMEWSARLARYATLLPQLQRGIPVDEAYKPALAGASSQLNAYDVVYYAGHANAGSKTIAINLPNDEEVQKTKGSRRLQLKNAMQAKFDKVLVPIANLLIDEDQRSHVTFDAFFGNTMFHEVAHGLGIKDVLSGAETVRESLKEQASALEEGKADVLGLYMVTKLHEAGELGDVDLMDNYVTFIASVFRSIRFGGSSAHGRANLARFNYFQEREAFSFNAETMTYRVDFDKMQAAMDALSNQILTFQGDGDYDGVVAFMAKYAIKTDQLNTDLTRLAESNIPVDITFEQGLAALGLE